MTVNSISSLAMLPKLGLGLGLRQAHFGHLLEHWPQVDWFEAISENFMHSGGRQRHILRQVAERYPVALHGVSMSIGSTDPLNQDYLRTLKRLADEIQAVWVSDHLCWTGIAGLNSHDLLPLPLTEESLAHVSDRIMVVQDMLQRPLVLENPSSYVSFNQSSMSEPEFLRELCKATGCGLLLDVNNVFVTCFNAGHDPNEYLNQFPFEHVVQMHLAGHQDCGTHMIDTHDQPVRPAVWELFRRSWAATGGASTLLEWDGDIPDFDRCIAELNQARHYMQPDSESLVIPPDSPIPPWGEAISTPLDFLVPPVMTDTRPGQ